MQIEMLDYIRVLLAVNNYIPSIALRIILNLQLHTGINGC